MKNKSKKFTNNVLDKNQYSIKKNRFDKSKRKGGKNGQSKKLFI
jgi:hypothetical protein